MVQHILDHHLIASDPAPIYLGELPPDYALTPAPVVVNLCGVFPQSAPPVRVVLGFAMHDSLDPTLLPRRADLERFLESVHLHARDEATYWHCHAGINRASFVLSTYLHLYHGMRIGDAIALLRRRRSPMVLCNNVFERMLREWYGSQDEQDFRSFTLDSYLSELRRHRALARTREAEIARRRED